MTWVDDAIKKIKYDAERKSLIESQSKQTFEDLWIEIKKQVDEISEKWRPLHTNGTQYHRVVSTESLKPRFSRFQEEDTEERKECHIELEGAEIKVSGDGANMTFTIDLCPDKVVCIKHNGEEIKFETAAMLILQPFAFPESLTGKGATIKA